MLNISKLQAKRCDKFVTILNGLIPEIDHSVIVKEINNLVGVRKYFKVSIKEMSDICNVSTRTIMRFEALKCDSLTLYLNYKFIFGDYEKPKKRRGT